MFLLLSFLIFLLSYHSEPKSWFSQIARILLMIVSAFLGMKLKETARIIPFVLLIFAILHKNRNFLRWFFVPKNALLLLGVSLLLVPVIPFRHSAQIQLDARSHLAIFNFRFGHFVQILRPLLQMFLGIAIAMAVALFLSTRGRQKQRNMADTRKVLPGSILFLAIWSAFCVLGFSLNFKVENNLRYLTTPLLPLTILAFVSYWNCVTSLHDTARRILNVAFVVVVVIGLQRHLDEIIFTRNFYGGVDIADYLLTKQLYEDRFNDSDASWQDLDDLFRGKTFANVEDAREIKIKEWDPNMKEKVKPENLAAVASKLGSVYVLSFNEALYAGDPKAQLLLKTTTANGSLYSRLLPKIKKKTNRRIFLYKYSA